MAPAVRTLIGGPEVVKESSRLLDVHEAWYEREASRFVSFPKLERSALIDALGRPTSRLVTAGPDGETFAVVSSDLGAAKDVSAQFVDQHLASARGAVAYVVAWGHPDDGGAFVPDLGRAILRDLVGATGVLLHEQHLPMDPGEPALGLAVPSDLTVALDGTRFEGLVVAHPNPAALPTEHRVTTHTRITDDRLLARLVDLHERSMADVRQTSVSRVALNPDELVAALQQRCWTHVAWDGDQPAAMLVMTDARAASDWLGLAAVRRCFPGRYERGQVRYAMTIASDPRLRGRATALAACAVEVYAAAQQDGAVLIDTHQTALSSSYGLADRVAAVAAEVATVDRFTVGEVRHLASAGIPSSAPPQ